jgi:DNA-binding MarR family transcriptional regulator
MRTKGNNPGTDRTQALARDLHVLLGQLRRKLQEQTHLGDYSWSQTSTVLRLERDGPATVSALARAEGVRPQSMGATVATLEASGLVSGSPDPADRRQTILSLTDACRKLIRAKRAAKEDWLLHAIHTQLSPEEQGKLAVALELLKRLADPEADRLPHSKSTHPRR